MEHGIPELKRTHTHTRTTGNGFQQARDWGFCNENANAKSTENSLPFIPLFRLLFSWIAYSSWPTYQLVKPDSTPTLKTCSCLSLRSYLGETWLGTKVDLPLFTLLASTHTYTWSRNKIWHKSNGRRRSERADTSNSSSTIRLADFWDSNPEAWLAFAESQFGRESQSLQKENPTLNSALNLSNWPHSLTERNTGL